MGIRAKRVIRTMPPDIRVFYCQCSCGCTEEVDVQVDKAGAPLRIVTASFTQRHTGPYHKVHLWGGAAKERWLVRKLNVD